MRITVCLLRWVAIAGIAVFLVQVLAAQSPADLKLTSNGKTEDDLSTGFLLEWVSPASEVPQGAFKCKVRLHYTGEEKIKLANWIAKGWGNNFEISLRSVSSSGKAFALETLYPRGFVKREPVTFMRGEERVLEGGFALNAAPGDYEAIAVLSGYPAIKSAPIRVRVSAGKPIDVRK